MSDITEKIKESDTLLAPQFSQYRIDAVRHGELFQVDFVNKFLGFLLENVPQRREEIEQADGNKTCLCLRQHLRLGGCAGEQVASEQGAGFERLRHILIFLVLEQSPDQVAIVACIGILRVFRQGAIVGGQRLVVAPQTFVDDAQAVVRGRGFVRIADLFVQQGAAGDAVDVDAGRVHV